MFKVEVKSRTLAFLLYSPPPRAGRFAGHLYEVARFTGHDAVVRAQLALQRKLGHSAQHADRHRRRPDQRRPDRRRHAPAPPDPQLRRDTSSAPPETVA